MARHAAIGALLGLAACTGAGTDRIGTTDSGGEPTAAWTPSERISRLVRGDEATRTAIRVHLPRGEDVPGDPWSQVVAMLEQVTDKPDGVEVEIAEVDLPTRSWTFDALQSELDGLTAPAGDDVATIDVLAVHGAYEDDEVLGLGWGWSRIAVFVDPLTASCVTAASGAEPGGSHTRVCEATWAGVLRHETGHLLGLVNNELPMVQPHEDPEHPHHDVGEDCLMYWRWDRADVAGKLATEPLDLCPASLADLAALRDAP